VLAPLLYGALLSGPAHQPERLRNLRAVLVLEQLGTADARGLLEKIAAGAPGDSLTEEARESLSRLRKGH